MRKALWAILLLAAAGSIVLASEPVRRVQEELRKRNLFFGDVDGKMSPELIGALRVYQSRKGFEATGQIDGLTASSLGMQTAHAAVVAGRSDWPDVPVLKSDSARQLPAEKQRELEQAAAANLETSLSPEIPAEAPNVSPKIDPQRVTKFVQDYLRDNEANDLAAQMKYYADPVDYFAHGRVSEKFVVQDNRNYMRRWPQRKYALAGPVKFAGGAAGNETVVEFPITFSVRSNRRRAEGKTRNWWTIRAEGEALKIVAIREKRAHE